ncbi:MAG: alpha/beta hydrolase [Thermoanaerobaculia bacterium]
MEARRRARPREPRIPLGPGVHGEEAVRRRRLLIPLASLLLSSTSLEGDIEESRRRRVAREKAFFPALCDAAGPGGFFETFDFEGDPAEPARLVAHAASPGRPRRRATIVFLHGKGGDASEWRRDAVRALRFGFNVLVPQLRGHAPSEGARITFGLRETEDLARLLAEAARRFDFDPARIAFDGASMGALLALHAAAGSRTVRALWLRSPFGDLGAMAGIYVAEATGLPRLLAAPIGRLFVALAGWTAGLPTSRLDPLTAARRVLCPAVVVHGERDDLVPLALGREVFAALGGEKELWIVPRAGHEHRVDEPSGLRAAEYARRWSDFLTRCLGVPPTPAPPAFRPAGRPTGRAKKPRRPRRSGRGA